MSKRKYWSSTEGTAKVYTIIDAKCPDMEQCWSACNGVDAFGHVDHEIRKARQKHGECLDKQPCCPRLILYRTKADSPLMAKIWTTRTLTDYDDHYLMLASLAKAMVDIPADWFHIELVDWAPDTAHNVEGRYELSVEVVHTYTKFNEMRQAHRDFHKTFDKGTWK